jgi:prepilin-type N-terminal cleavage/methylation domain-containing protein
LEKILYKDMKNKTGFTLIEILIVIAIIPILATLVIVAINPTKQFADARNSQRVNDVNNIQAAIQQYVVTNKGVLPTGLNTTEKQLGTCSSGGNTGCSAAASGCLDLSSTLAAYIPSIPKDPKSGTVVTTLYSVVADANNIITVKACAAENSQTIQLSR